MEEVPDGQFLVSGGKPSTSKTSSSKDNGRVIPTLEVGAQHEVYPKGVNSLHEFGKITPSQWEELVAQKTSPKVLELSARNTELAKRNKHHYYLGPGGYYSKEE